MKINFKYPNGIGSFVPPKNRASEKVKFPIPNSQALNARGQKMTRLYCFGYAAAVVAMSLEEAKEALAKRFDGLLAPESITEILEGELTVLDEPPCCFIAWNCGRPESSSQPMEQQSGPASLRA